MTTKKINCPATVITLMMAVVGFLGVLFRFQIDSSWLCLLTALLAVNLMDGEA